MADSQRMKRAEQERGRGCARVVLFRVRESVVRQGSLLRRGPISFSEQRDESRSNFSIISFNSASTAGREAKQARSRAEESEPGCERGVTDQKNTHKYHKLTKCHASTIYQHVRIPPRKCAKISNPFRDTMNIDTPISRPQNSTEKQIKLNQTQANTELVASSY